MVAGGCVGACAGSITDTTLITWHDLAPYFWRQLILVGVFYLSGYILGHLVGQKKITASVSRKMVCILTFMVSYANSLSIPALNITATCGLIAFGCIVILIMLGSLSAPFRKHIPILATVFRAINRPEDAPYTLAWLATENIVTSIVMIAFIPIINHLAQHHTIDQDILYGMMIIPVFASGIGDALAEIVGKKWGSHHYHTRSVFGDRIYTRSLEGSFMVFLTTLVVGIIVAGHFSFHMPVSFWQSFILLPITLTLAEAKSPHTWDNPLLYLTGYATIIACLW